MHWGRDAVAKSRELADQDCMEGIHEFLQQLQGITQGLNKEPVRKSGAKTKAAGV